MSAEAIAAPPQTEDDDERTPLADDASTANSTVTKLRDELNDAQQRLARALRFRKFPTLDSSETPNKRAGYVDVNFVRTKPSKRGRLVCKKVNVKTILHQFHADFPEGCVTALMGPSGAGKTTLLDFLTGMLGDSVHACGQVALPDDDAYVPQDDRLHGFYTCQAYMEHYARLTGMKPLFDCCGSTSKKASDTEHDISDEEGGGTPLNSGKIDSDDVDQLITDILSEVGLTAQKNTIVGGLFQRGLSGGQKRRLSVALEALSSPLNLFLDEPTSGLDSESALALMQYLHRYARSKDPGTGMRHRVIVTIHQPSSQIWEAIDNVVLLAGGRLMYQGPRREMDDFFGAFGHPVPVHYNPADHFIEVLFKMPEIDAAEGVDMPENAKSSDMWSNCFKKWSNDERQTDDAPVEIVDVGNRRKSEIVRRDPSFRKRDKMRNFTRKTSIAAVELTRRSFVSLLKNPIVIGLRLVIYAFASLMTGILFFDMGGDSGIQSLVIARPGLLYFITVFCSSMSVAVIPFAMIDRTIVLKEVRNHMFHPAFFHVAQSLTSIPVCLILSVVVSLIVPGMTGIKGGFDFMLTLFLTFLCADATSMFIAQVSPELISAICISSGIFGVFSIVMGFLQLPSKMPGLIWLYYISFMTYSLKALMDIEYSDLDFCNATDTAETIIHHDSVIYQANIPGSLYKYEVGLEAHTRNMTGLLVDGSELLKILEVDRVNVHRKETVLLSSGAMMPDDSVFGQVNMDSFCHHGGDVGEHVKNITGHSADGAIVLKMFEMDGVNVHQNQAILFSWACIMHTVTIVYLCWSNYRKRRMFVYSDED